MNRRELFISTAGLLNARLGYSLTAAAARPKRVIVAGAGLAGLTCAYELTKRGHDVVVLEASSRTGGHVHTLREGLPEGLYADVGAEHFTKPGYELCWRYFEELKLPVMAYPHREKVLQRDKDQMRPAQEIRDREQANLALDGFSGPEIRYLRQHPEGDLQQFYFARYVDKIKDEYQPFAVGLERLDELSVTSLLREEGASAAALGRFGSEDSALHTIWKLAILRLRHIDEDPHALYRLAGGNQGLPDALAKRLGGRIQTESPIIAIRHSKQGVQVTCQRNGEKKITEGDYLVCCMNAVVLRQMPVFPAWPEWKRYAIDNVPYTVETRPVFLSRTKFWKADGYSGNMDFATPQLGPLWPMAQEVATERGLMIGTAQAGVTADRALAVFKRYYPGQATIESARVVDWSRDPWSMTCEARTYRPGELRRMWPAVIRPVGRVHFAGAYCDNQSWGMEAATRSALRVARAVHEA